MTPSDAALQKAADAAYGAFYPTTIDRTAEGLPAWAGEPDKNPMLRPLRKALEVLESDALNVKEGRALCPQPRP